MWFGDIIEHRVVDVAQPGIVAERDVYLDIFTGLGTIVEKRVEELGIVSQLGVVNELGLVDNIRAEIGPVTEIGGGPVNKLVIELGLVLQLDTIVSLGSKLRSEQALKCIASLDETFNDV